jgi:hypothetical protein
VKLEKTEPAPATPPNEASAAQPFLENPAQEPAAVNGNMVVKGKSATASSVGRVNRSVPIPAVAVLLLSVSVITLLLMLVHKGGSARKVALGVVGAILLLLCIIIPMFIAVRAARTEEARRSALKAQLAAAEALRRLTIEHDRTKTSDRKEPAFPVSNLPPEGGVAGAPRVESAVPEVHTATREGSYDLGNGVTFVVSLRPPTAARDGKNPGYAGRLDWPKSARDGKVPSTDVLISNGNPFVAAWETGSSTLWVACGSAEEEPALAYLQEIKIRGPGDVETIGHSLRDEGGIPELSDGIRQAFNANGVAVAAPVTNPRRFLQPPRR